MKKLLKCAEPDDIDEWANEVANVKAMPNVDEKPQAPLIINEIQSTPNTKGLYNHNSFNNLQVGDVDNIDGKLASKFVSGKMKIEARLDLHGLSEKQAFSEVKDFIQHSYASGKRCILIITGKGLRQDPWWESKGVIRQSFSQWINHIEIRPYLLSVAQANQADGGSGAFYCLLKRQKG